MVKELNFLLGGSKIKLDKQHSLWLTLKYRSNILCIFRLPKLGGYLCEPRYVD
jgi:hypothetical protein